MRSNVIILALAIVSSFVCAPVTVAEIQPVSAITGFWGDYAGSVAVNGNTVFVGTQNGLSIIDASDPTDPIQIAFHSLPRCQDCWRIAYSAGIVFAVIPREPSVLVVIDVEDPENPHEISRISDLARSYNIFIDGSYAYICSNRGLLVLDISDPAEPTEIALCDTISFGDSKMVKNGNLLYVNQSDLWVFDVADPEHPRLSSRIANGFPVNSFEIYDHYGVIGTHDGSTYHLRMIDITNPDQPTELDTIHFYYPAEIEMSEDGSFAYVSNYSGVQIVDFRNGFDNGRLAGYWQSRRSIQSIAVSEYLYAASNYSGLRVMDVEDPEQPSEIGHYDEMVGAINTIVSDGYRAFSYYQNYLRIIDTSDPQHPNMSRFESNWQGISTISTFNHLLYVGGYDSSGQACIKVYDLSDDNINELGSVSLYSGLQKILRMENYLFAIVPDSIVTVDIQDLDRPLNVGGIAFASCTAGTVAGNYLYLVRYPAVYIFSINNPRRPHLISSITPFGNAYRGVAVAGDIAFVAQYAAEINPGLRLIDIHDPVRPTDFGSYDTPGTVNDLFIRDGLLYLSCGEAGISVVDVHDAQNPIEISTYDTPGFATTSAVRDSLIFVADRDNFGIYSFSPLSVSSKNSESFPLEFYLSPNYPNPFNAITHFSYGLPTASQVSIRVYDLTGREVATLVEGKKPAGVHRTILNAGNMPTGLYFVRLNANDQVLTQKVMLIR